MVQSVQYFPRLTPLGLQLHRLHLRPWADCNAIATACRCGFPSRLSTDIFALMVSLLFPFFSGMAISSTVYRCTSISCDSSAGGCWGLLPLEGAPSSAHSYVRSMSHPWVYPVQRWRPSAHSARFSCARSWGWSRSSFAPCPWLHLVFAFASLDGACRRPTPRTLCGLPCLAVCFAHLT